MARSTEAPRDAQYSEPGPAILAAAAAAATGAAAESSAGRAVGERAGLPALPRAAPPASRAPGSLGEQWGEKKGAEWGGGEGGEEAGGSTRGGGRRGRRERDAPLAAAAARPRLGGPGESGEPLREGGRRLAGGDSQTPVSLAAKARASPGPAHCGR